MLDLKGKKYMDKSLKDKWENLIEHLKGYDKVAIAFSGGVDSSFLLKAAAFAIGKENVIAVTADSAFVPSKELEEAKAITKDLEIEHIILAMDVLSIEAIKKNPRDRCYICKKNVFTQIIHTANNEGISAIFDGSNLDDDLDFRPGKKALDELKVQSPLKECGLTKNDIRELSKELGLPTWEKPSMACLASRIPYDDAITKEKLAMIEKAEDYISDLGFTQFRVRYHNGIARLELIPEEMPRIFDIKLMKQIHDDLKSFGFTFVAMDLSGYRMGNLN